MKEVCFFRLTAFRAETKLFELLCILGILYSKKNWKMSKLVQYWRKEVEIIQSQERRQKIFQRANSHQKFFKHDNTKLVKELEWIIRNWKILIKSRSIFSSFYWLNQSNCVIISDGLKNEKIFETRLLAVLSCCASFGLSGYVLSTNKSESLKFSMIVW